jgi:phage baseplate assembly protein W|tara:strand:+ start:7988 stop:8380 length:393 start_codon:yes stop_codon:yes gene_type:complete
MAGFSPRLPLKRSSIDGFTTHKTINGMVAQNLKMLILTSPGERVMEPEFGVGIRSFFFEPMRDDTYIRIQQRINKQISIYMPFVKVLNISFNSITDSPDNLFDYDEQYLGLTIEYQIDSIGAIEVLDILI